MGDMGDHWRDVAPAMKERSQAKRAENREQSAAILRAAGVVFYAQNDGAHLIVLRSQSTYDFWPGTGLWKVRGSTQRHRGIRHLLRHIGVPFPAARKETTK